MSRMSLGADPWTPRTSRFKPPEPDAKTSLRVRIAGVALRSIFLVALAVVVIHISLPQSETIWTVYDTPGDLIRLLLGLAACGWIGFQLFSAPIDFHANRTWLYLGATAVPFALICIVYIW